MRATFELTSAMIRWWLNELAGLTPPALRRCLTRSKPCLALVYQGTDIVLFRRSSPADDYELGRIGRSDVQATLPEGNECLASLAALADKRYQKWSLIIQVAQCLGMRKVVDLPLLVKDHLAHALKFELDQLTPFKLDDVYLAWRIQDTNNETERMNVLLEIVPKTLIESAIDVASKFQRQIDRIELDGEEGGYEPLDLRPIKERRIHPKTIWLGITTLALLSMAIYLPLQQQQAVVNNLRDRVSKIQDQAMDSIKLRDQLDFLTKEAEFLANARNTRRTMTEILAELTRILPTHSHILQLTVAESSIELLGLAEKASDLIALLDQSSMLSTPRFNSPVTRDTQSKKERFHLSVELIARGH